MLKHDLPLPDSDAIKHSDCVKNYVREYIKNAGGVIPFDLYMDLVLYAPGLGYYVTGSQKFGRSGDFVTAPEIGSLFSKCLARQVAEVLHRIGHGGILEIGPGTGALAAGLLKELTILGVVPDQYALLEISPYLKECQQKFLETQLGDQIECCLWLDDLPLDWEGVVLVNEVLDAVPVTRFQVGSDLCPLLAEVCDSGKDFTLSWSPSNELTIEAELIEKYKLPEGYTSEVSRRADAWVAEVASRLRRGLLLIIDYGYTEDEYYHGERSTGTLMCHYRHRSHMDPFWLPGLQDITAHVNFSALAKIGQSVGFDLAGFSNQEAFLLSLGLTDFVGINTDPRARYQISREIQQLATPFGMGGLFKVLGLSKNLDGELIGFSLRDRRETL